MKHRDGVHGIAACMLLAAIAATAPSALATSPPAYDLIFRGNLDPVTDAPQSDAESARFLTMATFGPSQAEIARLRGIGYGQWIEQQLAIPATPERPAVEALDAGVQNPGQSHRRA